MKMSVSEPIVVVSGLTLLSPDRSELAKNINFSLDITSRVGLVGANGSGKSTLLKRLRAAAESKEKNEDIKIRKGVVIEYVPQLPPDHLRDKLLMDIVLERLEPEDAWKGYALLESFGFTDDHLLTCLGDLSGGEINKALLARALIVDPHLLLLDEPTNHLDIGGVVAFEKLLAQVKKPFLLISHDRRLLNTVTKQTIFLAYQQLYAYGLPYSAAKEAFRIDREALLHQRKEQEKRHAEIVENVRWLREKATISDDMAPRYRAALTKLERFEHSMVEVPKEKVRSLALSATQLRCEYVIRVEQWQVAVPGGRNLFVVPQLFLKPGDRAVIMGNNGAGKSTFLESLVSTARSKRASKEIVINPQVELGYYDQEQRGLDSNASPFSYLDSIGDLTTQQLHQALASAGFPYERQAESISKLSGGERARLLLLGIQKRGTNLLILDEPTNHIDVQGVEALEEELQSFSGSVVFVSHDRSFVEAVANRFFVIRDGRLDEVSGYQQEVIGAM